MMTQPQNKHHKTCICTKDPKKIERGLKQLFIQIERYLPCTEKHEVNIIMGDFNSIADAETTTYIWTSMEAIPSQGNERFWEEGEESEKNYEILSRRGTYYSEDLILTILKKVLHLKISCFR